MILVLPVNKEIVSIIKSNTFDPSGLRSSLHGCGEYVLAYCASLRNDTQEPDIVDFIPTHQLSASGCLNDLIYLLNKYSQSVLNELAINNIVNPYTVTIDEIIFTISNKEEYE